MAKNFIDPKEKLIIEYVISDSTLLSQVFNLFKKDYFFKPSNQVVEFIRNYFAEYKETPSPDILKTEFDLDFKYQEITNAIFQYALDEIEDFAKKRAMRNAIEEGIDHLQKEQFTAIDQKMRDALRVQLDSSLGLSYFENPEERIRSSQEETEAVPCGIGAIDQLCGNLKRKELGIIAGESGLGKSNILINILKNMAEKGYNCVYISLELSVEQVGSRLDGMVTGYPVHDAREYPDIVGSDLRNIRDQYGDIVIKYLPAETTPSELMAFLVEYQIQRGAYPDVLIVDYIDEMDSDDPAKKYNIGEKDKDITARLRNIVVETNSYGITAAQMIKEAADITKINRSHISGGAFKVNKSDWTIAAFATEEDIDNNMLNFTQVKIRSSEKTKAPKTAYINPKNLVISDNPIKERDIHTGSTNRFINHQGRVPQAHAEEADTELAQPSNGGYDSKAQVGVSSKDQIRKKMDLKNIIH